MNTDGHEMSAGGSQPAEERSPGRMPPEPATHSVLRALTERQGIRPSVMLHDAADQESPVIVPQRHSRREDVDPDSRYHVLGEIATGGMGVVYKGRDTDLGRDVAFKALRKRHTDNRVIVHRFVEEAQIGGQLQHPGVVPVYELGLMAGSRPYFTMKLVKGRTLAALLDGRSGPKDELVRFLGIFERVCQTIAYAHARGVIHRDIKPSNIMLGSFGEVQVMDWGLSKVLDRPSTVDAAEAAETVIETLRTSRSESLSRAGSVMGTYAYMPPEQAAGDVGRLNERTDVFALGAVLCQILTGAPPYEGKTSEEVHRRALGALLDDALQRIDDSGADQILVDLVRHCLEPQMKQRPEKASSVASTVSRYLTSLEERANQSRLEAVRSEARAGEATERVRQEQRARKLSLSLAAVILLIVAAAGVTWYALGSAAAERHEIGTREVNESLAEATNLHGRARAAGSDMSLWERALDAVGEAHERAASGDVDAALTSRTGGLKAKISAEHQAAQESTVRDRKDQMMVAHLEAIRSHLGEHGDWKLQVERYDSAFREHGIDLKKLRPDEAGRLIRESNIAGALISALDAWSLSQSRLRMRTELRAKIAKVAALADTNAARSRIRKAVQASDKSGLERFARSLQLQTCSASTLDYLGTHVAWSGNLGAAIEFYRRAQQVYPADFWINHNLAGWLSKSKVPTVRSAHYANQLLSHNRSSAQRTEEALRFYEAAHALRPDSSDMRLHLGNCYVRLHRWDRALAVHDQILATDRVAARKFLSAIYQEKGELTKVVQICQKAMAESIAPGYFRVELSLMYVRLGRNKEALETCNEGIILNPRNPVYHHNRGVALKQLNRFEESLKALRQARDLDRGHSDVYNEIGILLRMLHRPDEAIPEYKTAIALGDKRAAPWHNLGNALADLGKWGEAIKAFRKGISVENDSSTLFMLGVTQQRAGKAKDAIRTFERLIQGKPNHAGAHYSLGLALVNLGSFEAGIESYRRCLLANPKDGWAPSNLCYSLAMIGRFGEALKILEPALSLRPKSALMLHNRGWIRHMLGDPVGALEALMKARDEALKNARKARSRDGIEALIGLSLIASGKIEESLPFLAKAAELSKPGEDRTNREAYNTEAKGMLALLPHLEDFVRGARKPETGREALRVARILAGRESHARGARFYEAAFGKDPSLAEDLDEDWLSDAIRSASLGGSGKGKDAETTTDEERKQLRSLARNWLDKGAALHRAALDAEKHEDRYRSLKTVRLWKVHKHLEEVRDPEKIAGFDSFEQFQWRSLWAHLDDLEKEAESRAATRTADLDL